MGPLTSLLWLLATIPLAEPAQHDPTHPGATPHSPRTAASDMGRRVRRGDEENEDGSKKVLRYALQQREVNITMLPDPPKEARPVEAGLANRPGGLTKRDNDWNWKHLTDYRGFLYFIESASRHRSIHLSFSTPLNPDPREGTNT